MSTKITLHSFNGPIQRLTLRHSPWAPGMVTWEVLETYRERLNCVASGWVVEGEPPFTPCRIFYPCHSQVGTNFTVLSLSVYGQIWICIGLVQSAYFTWWLHGTIPHPIHEMLKAFSWRAASPAHITLLGVCGPQARGDWYQCALSLLLCSSRFSTATKPKSLLTLWTPLHPPWWVPETLHHPMYILQEAPPPD